MRGLVYRSCIPNSVRAYLTTPMAYATTPMPNLSVRSYTGTPSAYVPGSVRPISVRAYASTSKLPDTTPNYHVISNIDEYKSFHSLHDDRLVVTFYSASFSLWGRMLQCEFQSLSDIYPQHTFLEVDVDVCPRAAYHAEVNDVPSVVLMWRDDTWRESIHPIGREGHSEIITRATKAIQLFSIEKAKKESSSNTSMLGHIPKDNMWAVEGGGGVHR
eukprot:GHVR01155693.1.p1 GENE.GHVR01155693.1~~GHVR01155693.1.p1  ORF type:complete len:216 (+),score=37.76 GHVR01155693.1:34-681(+)